MGDSDEEAEVQQPVTYKYAFRDVTEVSGCSVPLLCFRFRQVEDEEEQEEEDAEDETPSPFHPKFAVRSKLNSASLLTYFQVDDYVSLKGKKFEFAELEKDSRLILWKLLCKANGEGGSEYPSYPSALDRFTTYLHGCISTISTPSFQSYVNYCKQSQSQTEDENADAGQLLSEYYSGIESLFNGKGHLSQHRTQLLRQTVEQNTHAYTSVYTFAEMKRIMSQKDGEHLELMRNPVTFQVESSSNVFLKPPPTPPPPVAEKKKSNNENQKEEEEEEEEEEQEEDETPKVFQLDISEVPEYEGQLLCVRDAYELTCWKVHSLNGFVEFVLDPSINSFCRYGLCENWWLHSNHYMRFQQCQVPVKSLQLVPSFQLADSTTAASASSPALSYNLVAACAESTDFRSSIRFLHTDRFDPRPRKSADIKHVFGYQVSAEVDQLYFSAGLQAAWLLNEQVEKPTAVVGSSDEEPAENQTETAAKEDEEQQQQQQQSDLISVFRLVCVPYALSEANHTIVEVPLIPDSNRADPEYATYEVVDMEQPITCTHMFEWQDQRYIALSGPDSIIYVFQLSTLNLQNETSDAYSLVGKLGGHSAAVTSISALPASGILISTASDGIVRIWDLNSFECVCSERISENSINCCIAVNEETGTFLTGSVDGSVRRWTFSPQSKLVAAGVWGDKHQIKVGDSVRCLTHISDKVYLAGCADGVIRIYKVDAGPAPLVEIPVYRSAINHIIALPEQRKLITAGQDGAIRMLHFVPEDVEAARQILEAQVKALPPKEYLFKTVYPALLLSLKAMERDRPVDVCSYLAFQLLRYQQYLQSCSLPSV